MNPSGVRPRLVVNCAANELDEFERMAQAATALAGQYDLRLVVSHLARPKRHALHDPGDPYLHRQHRADGGQRQQGNDK